jgi:hypothetical protein
VQVPSSEFRFSNSSSSSSRTTTSNITQALSSICCSTAFAKMILALRWLSRFHQPTPARLLLAVFPKWMIMTRSPSTTTPVFLPGTPTSEPGPANLYISSMLAVLFLLLGTLILTSYLFYQWTTVSPPIFVTKDAESEPTPALFLEHEVLINETALYRSDTFLTSSDTWAILKVCLAAAWSTYSLVSLHPRFTVPCI